jgi:hypothetical protein
VSGPERVVIFFESEMAAELHGSQDMILPDWGGNSSKFGCKREAELASAHQHAFAVDTIYGTGQACDQTRAAQLPACASKMISIRFNSLVR